MARARNPHSFALTTLRGALSVGAYRPGAPIVIQDEARRLAISPTPVREALARLAGEGLVEDRHGEGYVARSMDAGALADLYALHELYVLAALARTLNAPWVQTAWPSSPGPAGPSSPAHMTHALFSMIVSRCGNGALWRAHERTSVQLAPARLAEAVLFADHGIELALLKTALGQGDVAQKKASVRAYHQRRRIAVGALAAHLNTPP